MFHRTCAVERVLCLSTAALSILLGLSLFSIPCLLPHHSVLFYDFCVAGISLLRTQRAIRMLPLPISFATTSSRTSRNNNTTSFSITRECACILSWHFLRFGTAGDGAAMALHNQPSHFCPLKPLVLWPLIVRCNSSHCGRFTADLAL